MLPGPDRMIFGSLSPKAASAVIGEMIPAEKESKAHPQAQIVNFLEKAVIINTSVFNFFISLKNREWFIAQSIHFDLIISDL